MPKVAFLLHRTALRRARIGFT